MKFNIPLRVAPEVVLEYPELPPIIVQLLHNRGITNPGEVGDFLQPEYHRLHDPFSFRDMERVVTRIYEVIQHKQLIGIHGDYDADGVAGTLIIQSVISKIGGGTEVYLPHREHEGYGLKKAGVDYFQSKNVTVIITCDCGISNKEEIAYARSKGIDVIITDHHTIPDQIPEAYAILHPLTSGEQYPWKHLAGGGVAFKLAQALLRSSRNPFSVQERERSEKWLLDLAAISTIADMVPLRGENRILAKYGLVVLAKTRRPGLLKLYAGARIEPDTITSETVSYQIAPRINAAGRMDHANHAYALLATTDPIEAEELARRLERHNSERQKQTDKIFLEAKKNIKAEDAVIIIYQGDWPAGLLGLVAGKLVKETSRPVFLLCREGESIVGSGRSIEGLNILDALEPITSLLTSYGGHRAACGFRCESRHLNAVITGIKSYFAKEGLKSPLEKTLSVDLEISLSDISWELLDYLRQFEPFGIENNEPLFISRNVEILEQRLVGKTNAHVKFILKQGATQRSGIGFNLATSLTPSLRFIDIIYYIRLNQWNGMREIELVLRQVTPA